ncbi:DUF488 family protein [Candidatus Pacearchaeota archaeon]|nr:DUF488 family protein [Candidatus Pacearchaeota archaeon]
MSITTSYFAVAGKVKGKKISIARYHHPRIRGSIDEVIESFAPSPDLLLDYKAGAMDWAEYKKRYVDEQRQHFRENPQDFNRLISRAKREKLVLLCYERFEGQDTRCHRMLLYDILKKAAEKKGKDILFIDEKPYERQA